MTFLFAFILITLEDLARLGAEGVLAGVKDSSGDDVSLDILFKENEKNGHPLTL